MTIEERLTTLEQDRITVDASTLALLQNLDRRVKVLRTYLQIQDEQIKAIVTFLGLNRPSDEAAVSASSGTGAPTNVTPTVGAPGQMSKAHKT